ncbi:MAG: RnfABCDGE type electron transport complex subunit D [Rhodobacter sp.]|nr:RnfABCDGE type electron transport complex subunit D [Rhodobacter sp.]
MIRGLWTPDTVGWLLVAAGAPVAVAMILDQGPDGLIRLALGLAVVAAWQSLFRFNMGVMPAPASAITALAVAVMAPHEVPLWQIGFAVSFGAVVGELIFGGWGRNFLNASAVALSFLSLSVPNADFVAGDAGLALAVVPGAIMLALTGILPISILAAFATALWVAAMALGLTPQILAAPGTLVFAVVFLVADPVASAATPLGRWVQGALAGAFTAFLMTGTSVPQAVVFAALLAGLFAPLVDQGIIALHLRWRRVRHARP